MSARRALWRLSWRDARRHPVQSWLVIAMIALPVAGMVAGVVLLATVSGTAEQQATQRLGRADLVLTDWAGAPRPLDEVRGLLPPDAEVQALTEQSGVEVVGNAGQFVADLVSTPADGLTTGSMVVVDGRLATDRDEAALTQPFAVRSGLAIGDVVSVAGLGRATVVGTVLDADASGRSAVVTTSTGIAESADWAVGLVAGADVADEVVGEAEAAGFVALTRADAAVPGQTERSLVLVLGGFALVEAGLVAAAAFAVSVRRRQRELGLLAAGGGEPHHLRLVVRLSGIGFGVVASVLGAIVGLGGTAVAMPLVRAGARRVVDGMVVPTGQVAVAVVLGVVTAVLAAALPARGAVRLPVTAALAGRRPTSRPGRRWAQAGVALVVAGAAVVASVTTLGRLPMPEALRPIALPGVVLLGSVLVVVGFGAVSPWILERIGRVAPRLPLGLRLAVRDVGRFRTRNGPVVTAVLAGLAGSVALSTVLASLDAQDRSLYEPGLFDDQVVVSGPSATVVADRVAGSLPVLAASPLVGVGSDDESVSVAVPSDVAGSDEADEPIVMPGLVVGDESTVRALGGDDEAVAALDAGRVVVFARDPAVDRVVVVGPVPSGGSREVELDAHAVQRAFPAYALPGAVASPSTLAASGLATEEVPWNQVVIRATSPVTADQAAAARSAAAEDGVGTTVQVEQGWTSTYGVIGRALTGAALVAGLAVLAISLALSAAESRDDQRTLVAVGSGPRVRRDLAAGRALVLAGLGGLLAVPAGLVPAVGVLSTLPEMGITLDWRSMVVACLGLPVLAVAGAWMLTRSTPEWTAHRRV